MTPQDFEKLMRPVMAEIAEGPVDTALEDRLNTAFPSGGEAFEAIESVCHAAIAEGWMCANGDGGRRYGRVIEATPETRDLSVDVVDLRDIVGPHHRHPTGEICMIMPVDAQARFDGRGAGWCVNPPGSEHRPTVTGGRALVLYLLPNGHIEFT